MKSEHCVLERFTDPATNPAEAKNVIAQHLEIYQALEKKITGIVRNGRTAQGASQPNDTGYCSDLKWMSKAKHN